MTYKDYKILKDTLPEDCENMISINGEKIFFHLETDGWNVDNADNEFRSIKIYRDCNEIFCDKIYDGKSLDDLYSIIELEHF